MEYKQVEKCTRREETTQNNILFTERSEKFNLSKIAESKIISILESTNTVNIETKRELRENTEELNLNGSNKISLISVEEADEIVKEANFEYEEEWNIGGIPELLSELDADIASSVKNNQATKFENVKIPTNNKQVIRKISQPKHFDREKIRKNANSNESTASLKLSKNQVVFEKNIPASTFTGFSKGGHLISNSTSSVSHCSSSLFENIDELFKPTKKIEGVSCSISMSSQTGNNGIGNSNISGSAINVTCGHNSSSSSSNNKSNNKMSIDHQATLDKGLKMKIKRTKPGTKSSEAKHEIVKASEQQQNVLIGGANNICATSHEDITCLLSNQSSSSNSQNSNVPSIINSSQGSLNSTGNKKNLVFGNNQNITSPTSGNISLNSNVSASNSVSQTLLQGTKRGSSGHRRDKTKEKSSHSNRAVIEKNSSATTDKDSMDKPLCQCSSSDSNASTCCNSSCNRKTENNILTQRSPAKNICGNTSVVPPGVFTPSTDSNLLAVTSTISTPVCTQTLSSGVNSNSPGPPSKDISNNNGTNVKISSHIAAQLAAVAASNNATNGSSLLSSSFPNTELKSSSSNIQGQSIKQLSPSHTILALVPNEKTSSVLPTEETEKAISISNFNNENLELPPPKRVKQTDKDSSISSINKEMVDICIGTSIGTVTEPDCLGPCEPGTSVTLEGIVWHETEGGVLVVNVTWRGKTYVGTLLDCTRHDWAPPRFCDSPTEDLDSRTPKGRAKRNRAATTPDLSNFTETRSSIYFSHSHVHSKLRNGSNKGRATTRTTAVSQVDKNSSGPLLSSGNSGLTPITSPIAFLPSRVEKRKSKDESPLPDNEVVNSGSINTNETSMKSGIIGLANQPQNLINPVTGLNVQISVKKCKTSSVPCAISPVLLECPENDCSKKYKHVNGLRYHQSHAHGTTSLLDEDSIIEGHTTPQPSPLSSTPTLSFIPNASDLVASNPIAISSHSATAHTSEQYNKSKINAGTDVCQELETLDQHFAAETVSSTSCEEFLASTAANSAISPIPCATESTTISKIDNDEKPQMLNAAENTKTNTNVVSLDSNNEVILKSSAEKSGIVHYGQVESKNDSLSCSIPTKTSNQISMQLESLESGSSKNCVADNQGSNKNIFCSESLDKMAHHHQNQHNIPTKTSSDVSNIGKCKKERRSSLNNDFESVKLSTCNLLSREDIQSPAYSDISDDSTPVNDSDHTDKVSLSLKSSNLVKKSQDIDLTVPSSCPSSETKISSTLGNYRVYQYYQQQQFIVPPTIEEQEPTKNTLNSNVGSTMIMSPSMTQHQTVSDFCSKKDPPLDLISKTNLDPPIPSQHCQEINKDSMLSVSVIGDQCNNDLSSVSSIGPDALNSTTPPKPVSHFYAFNYMPSNYSFNVDHTFGSPGTIATSEDITKANRHSEITSPNEQSQQQLNTALYKDDRSREEISSPDVVKSPNQQISSKQLLKSDSIGKSDFVKQESISNPLSQIPQHIQIHSKDHQGINVYANMYQRHPLTLSSQQISRDEELRRYYIYPDQQRRQNSSSHNQQTQNTTGNLQCKDDAASSQQHGAHNQPQIKIKGNAPLNINKLANSSNTSKESPKHKQEEDIKVIKQEGQKPTMETQGPPPPPTSQYFLHPSFITSSPFGFDPSHPMYRNVLLPASSPYTTPSYHLPIPRYHAPEDLSRNTGTKALDALHHAASQYYTTHKIHELSERALKSPSNSNVTNVPGTMKISGSSPNITSAQQSNIGPNILNHHSSQNNSAVTQLPHNLAPQTLGKHDITSQKTIGSGPGVPGTSNELQKSQANIAAVVTSNCSSGNSSSNNCVNINGGSASDSRSPPPQRHVHTHHHTHVGLGYPMYPAPYGAAVLASQQAAAVAVINPYPPGPNK